MAAYPYGASPVVCRPDHGSCRWYDSRWVSFQVFPQTRPSAAAPPLSLPCSVVLQVPATAVAHESRRSLVSQTTSPVVAEWSAWASWLTLAPLLDYPSRAAEPARAHAGFLQISSPGRFDTQRGGRRRRRLQLAANRTPSCTPRTSFRSPTDALARILGREERPPGFKHHVSTSSSVTFPWGGRTRCRPKERRL